MSKKKDSLGDRIKWYEKRYMSQFMPCIPVIARVDGRAFHSFTKGLERPFCGQLSQLMILTTKFLVQETNARCGYTQSDEISLVWLAEDWDNEIFFAAKLQKMNSILASMTSVYFNRNLEEYLPSKKSQMPLFDCRVFQVPSEKEAANYFIWREQDATRNSLQMAARSVYSHKELHLMDSTKLHDMLHDKGINWNDYPNHFKRGTYVRRITTEKELSVDELNNLPEKHDMRKNPNLKVKRTHVTQESFEPITRYSNRSHIILHGQEPILAERTVQCL